MLRTTRLITTTALTAALLAGAAAPAQAATFRDTESSTFAAQISWLADEGISTGWSDGTFRPARAVTRDQMAAFLYRLAGSPAYTAPKTSAFADLTPRSPFYKEVHWLKDAGITNGWTRSTGKPVFRPARSISRDQMAAFLYRYAGSPAYSAPNTSGFKDLTARSPFYKEISWLKDAGITNGWASGDGHIFRPTATVSREVMAAFLYRLDHNGKDPVAPAAPQGQTKSGFITGYAIHDNDPYGSKGIAYSSAWNSSTLHKEAGGTGTYDDPITIAAPKNTYAPGTRIYLPHVKRYGMVEDLCATSWTAVNGCTSVLDLWVGGEMSDKADDTRKCNEKITGTYKFIVNPGRGLPVTKGSLFNSTTDTCTEVVR